MKVLAFISLILFCAFANADVMSGQGTITQVTITDDVIFVVHSSPAPDDSGEGCLISNSGAYVHVFDDSNVSKRLYAAIIAAYTQKQTVTFWVQGCGSTPIDGTLAGGSYPKIKGIIVDIPNL